MQHPWLIISDRKLSMAYTQDIPTCLLKTFLVKLIITSIQSSLKLNSPLCNKDQYIMCCDIFFPLTWLKLSVICIKVALLLACTWQKHLSSFLKSMSWPLNALSVVDSSFLLLGPLSIGIHHNWISAPMKLYCFRNTLT